MKELNDLYKKLEELMLLPYESIPDIGLYMDQVLAYLARRPGSFREEDKITAAMVNNYVKAGILPRANGKKYSSEHLLHLMIISRLKQVLSVKDTGALLAADRKDKGEAEYYSGFGSMLEKAADKVKASLDGSEETLSQAAMRLAVESYVTKVACEYIVDMIAKENTPPEKEKKQKSPKGKEGASEEAGNGK